VSKKQKLINRLKSKPRDFTFDEATTLLLSLGFRLSNKGRTSGSRVSFHLGSLSITLHKPHPQKELLPEQVRDILKKLEGEGLI
jgi:hypothetical protein